MDALRSLNIGWHIAGAVFVVLLIGWLMADPMPDPVPFDFSTLTPDQQAYYRKMFEVPVLSPDEWQAQCDPMHGQKWGTESLDSHCSIQVVVDCPPDCGVYKILREDTLLRRIW